MLASSNETIRVESVRVLSYLGQAALLDSAIFDQNLLSRLVVLIDEGLLLNTEYMQE